MASTSCSQLARNRFRLAAVVILAGFIAIPALVGDHRQRRAPGNVSEGWSDQKLIDNLILSVYASESEMLAIGPEVPAQSGAARIERLVLGDPCGALGLSVRIQRGVLRIVNGTVARCPKGVIRTVLVDGAKIGLDGEGLTIVTAEGIVKLPRVTIAPFTLTSVRSYRTRGGSNTEPGDVRTGLGGLRRVRVFDGCNDIATSVAFTTNKFVIDPAREMTAVGCTEFTPNAAGAFLENNTNTGTYWREGNTLTMTFLDGARAILTVS